MYPSTISTNPRNQYSSNQINNSLIPYSSFPLIYPYPQYFGYLGLPGLGGNLTQPGVLPYNIPSQLQQMPFTNIQSIPNSIPQQTIENNLNSNKTKEDNNINLESLIKLKTRINYLENENSLLYNKLESLVNPDKKEISSNQINSNNLINNASSNLNNENNDNNNINEELINSQNFNLNLNNSESNNNLPNNILPQNSETESIHKNNKILSDNNFSDKEGYNTIQLQSAQISKLSIEKDKFIKEIEKMKKNFNSRMLDFDQLKKKSLNTEKELEKQISICSKLKINNAKNLERIDLLENENKTINTKLTRTEDYVKKIKEENSNLISYLDKLKDDLAAIKQEQGVIEKDKAKLDAELNLIEKEKIELEKKLKVENSRFNQLKEEFDGLNQKHSILKKENLSLDNKLEDLRENHYFLVEENQELAYRKNYLEKENKSLLFIVERNKLSYQVPSSISLANNMGGAFNRMPGSSTTHIQRQKERSRSKGKSRERDRQNNSSESPDRLNQVDNKYNEHRDRDRDTRVKVDNRTLNSEINDSIYNHQLDKENYPYNNERNAKKRNNEFQRHYDVESIDTKVIVEEDYADQHHNTANIRTQNSQNNNNRNFNKIKSNYYTEEPSANFGQYEKNYNNKKIGKEVKVESFIDKLGENSKLSRNKELKSNIKNYNSNSSQEKNDQLRSKESNYNNNIKNRNLSKDSSHSKIKTNYNNTEQDYFMLHRNRKDDKEGFMFRERERSNERQKENMEYLKTQNVLNEKYYPKQAKLAKLKEENIDLKNELSRLNGEKKELENKVVNFPDKQISKFQMNKRQKLEKDLEDNIERINQVKRRMREIKSILDY